VTGHLIDQRLGHRHLAFGRLGRFRRCADAGGIDQLIGEVHQVENEQVLVRPERGEMLAGFDH
jgi:hypothetical protein